MKNEIILYHSDELSELLIEAELEKKSTIKESSTVAQYPPKSNIFF